MSPPIEEEDSNQYNFRELVDALNECKDFILTIPTEQVEELKEGIQVRKSKDNYALRKKGVEPLAESLSFIIYPAKDSTGAAIEGQACVRIKLVPRKAIDVIKMEFPDPNL